MLSVCSLEDERQELELRTQQIIKFGMEGLTTNRRGGYLVCCGRSRMV